jgi:hypothetical protein
MAWVFVFVVNKWRPDILESAVKRGRKLRAKIYVILLAARNGEYKMADDPKDSDIRDVMREEKAGANAALTWRLCVGEKH